MEKSFGEIPIMKKENLVYLKKILKEYKFKILLRQRFNKIVKSKLQFLAKEYELENDKGENLFLSLFVYPKKLVFSFYGDKKFLGLGLESLTLFIYHRKTLGENKKK